MGEAVDAAYVIGRLEAAGRTLLALPVSGTRPGGFRSCMPEIVREKVEGYGWHDAPMRPAVPGARDVSAMDEALSWIALIPADRSVVRRIVGARALVSPRHERHLFSWRQIARQVGASHEAVRRWHGYGIGLIVAALARPGLCEAAGGVVGPSSGAAAAAVRRATVERRVEPAAEAWPFRPIEAVEMA